MYRLRFYSATIACAGMFQLHCVMQTGFLKQSKQGSVSPTAAFYLKG